MQALTLIFARNARALLAVALCALGVAHLLYHAQYTLDDAYITFRYSRNLVRGLGLVYNPGDYVKGYSNTLYTLVMALPELLGRDPIAIAKLLGVASFCAVCALGYRLYAAEPSDEVRDRGPWFVALCAVSTPLAVHSMNGLETGSYTALVVAAVLARLHEQRTAGVPWSALLFCAVVWSRPEGIALFAAMAVHDAALRLHRRTLSARDVAFYAAPVLAYAGELGLSQLYYGDPLPQTFYAKVRPTGGLAGAADALWQGVVKQASPQSYLAKGLDSLGGGLWILLFLPLSLLHPARRRINSALLLVLLAQLVFIVRSRSDWAPAFRFGVPVLPFVFVLLLEAIAAAALLFRARRRLAFSLLTAALLAFVVPPNVRDARTIEARRYVDAGAKLAEGARLAQLADPGITLASIDIGGHGYAAGGFDILDTAGLTVRALARCAERPSTRCKRYVALVRPELIRRHPGDRDDALTSKPARRSGLYMELDGGRYAILRALTLRPSLPEHAAPVAAQGGVDLRLVGTDVPQVVVAATNAVMTLFWRRGVSASAPPPRRLLWRQGDATSVATATAALWTRAQLPALWTPELIFADRVVVRAPEQPGRYALAASVQGVDVGIGAIEVVAQADAATRAPALARQAAQLARAGRTLSAMALYERALQLDRVESVRNAYQRLVVQHARLLARDALRARAGDPAAAIDLLRDAKTVLHRAFWQSARAGAELRGEIDANAAQLAALVRAELAHR